MRYVYERRTDLIPNKHKDTETHRDATKIEIKLEHHYHHHQQKITLIINPTLQYRTLTIGTIFIISYATL